MSQHSIIITVIGSLALVGAFIGVYSYSADRSSLGTEDELALLATCLKERGATFYGSFWCPHCQEQKKDFGPAKDLLPYVECSTPDGRGQLDVCAQAGIEGYPTWKFADGRELSGRIALVSLAEVTGCPAPARDTEETPEVVASPEESAVAGGE
jgi:hypothetical protein